MLSSQTPDFSNYLKLTMALYWGACWLVGFGFTLFLTGPKTTVHLIYPQNCFTGLPSLNLLFILIKKYHGACIWDYREIVQGRKIFFSLDHVHLNMLTGSPLSSWLIDVNLYNIVYCKVFNRLDPGFICICEKKKNLKRTIFQRQHIFCWFL